MKGYFDSYGTEYKPSDHLSKIHPRNREGSLSTIPSIPSSPFSTLFLPYLKLVIPRLGYSQIELISGHFPHLGLVQFRFAPFITARPPRNSKGLPRPLNKRIPLPHHTN